GVVHKRCAHLRSAPALVVPSISLDGVCLCRSCRRSFLALGRCETTTGFCLRLDRCGWRPGRGLVGTVRSKFDPLVLAGDLRLLAHQPKFLPDAVRHPACDLVPGLCVVPLGICAARLQPSHSAWKDFVAGLLGAHRIRLRTLLDPAEGAVQHPESYT